MSHAVRSTRRVPAWILLAVALVLTGCSLANAGVQVRSAIKEAGVSPTSVSIGADNGVTTLVIVYVTGQQTAQARAGEMDRVAESVWRKAPVGFDELSLSALQDGDETLGRTFAAPALQERYGPRPDGLVRDTGNAFRKELTIFSVGALGLIAAFAIVMVVLVRRSRRRPPATQLDVWRPRSGGNDQPPGPAG